MAFPISVVAAQIGLSQATLRMWQQRYGLAPTRTTAGGHRRYSRDDIERLVAVQRLIAAGVSTGDAARAVLAAARHDIPLPANADPTGHLDMIESSGNTPAVDTGHDTAEQLTQALRRVVLAVERWRLRAARTKLKMGATEMIAIGSLGAEGPQTPSQIAARLQITTPSVTELLNRLERAELVTRRRHPTDGRRTLVTLTDLGRRQVDTVLHEFSTIVARSCATLAPDDQRLIAAFLHNTASAIETTPTTDTTTQKPPDDSAPWVNAPRDPDPPRSDPA